MDEKDKLDEDIVWELASMYENGATGVDITRWLLSKKGMSPVKAKEYREAAREIYKEIHE